MSTQLDLFDASKLMGRKGGKSTSETKQKAARSNGMLGGRPLSIAINDDGVSIKGCSIIYAPAGQAGEYAPLATNPYRGCGHKCAYCYVPTVLKVTRAEFDEGAYPRKNFLDALEKDARKYQVADIDEQVMLSFTTDPYHPGDNSLTREVLVSLASHGMAFCTLTKGGARALRDLHLFRPNRDAFASTLTSTSDAFSMRWERGAALASERIVTLRKFHDAGIFTWVSCEPTLSAEETLRVIEETHQFVDLYKIGKANYVPSLREIDWEAFTHRVIDLCQKHNIHHYVKRDLQQYLPVGYCNPKRITQHH